MDGGARLAGSEAFQTLKVNLVDLTGNVAGEQ